VSFRHGGGAPCRSARHRLFRIAAHALGLCAAPLAHAQLADLSQAPNTENAGIARSLADQIGTGVGDAMTPGSSAFIVARDPARAIRRGRQLFQRKFTVQQGFGPRLQDGSGDIETHAAIGAGLTDSCAGCHGRPRGAAGFGGDVATRPDSRDAPHLFGLGLQQMLADEITADLRAARERARAQAKQLRRRGGGVAVRLVSKGIDFGVIAIDADGQVDTSRLRGVDADLRVKPFFAHGATATLREFIVGALADEMGLQAVDPLLAQAAAGARMTTPTGTVLDGRSDRIKAPAAKTPLDDPDIDGVQNEFPAALVDYLEFYLFNYFGPGTYRQTPYTQMGLKLMERAGCTDCHVQNLTVERDRRVADVQTVYDRRYGLMNGLYATASLQLTEYDDGSGHPTIKQPNNRPFVVRNIFTDLRRHDLGPAFHERNYDGTIQKTFMTEPLWGVGSTAPYGHDGRSINLREVILRHGGEARSSREAFAAMPEMSQAAIVACLETLVLFPPDDTASNLDPGDPAAPGYPQREHGSIRLSILFNDPSEPE
jgi:hypothetical protein